VSEIERSIYNVVLANQDGTRGIRYHAVLHGRKENGTANNTCCEGNGTRLYGRLPELVFSLGADGLYVNLYATSTITWKQDQETIWAKVVTGFPYEKKVQLSFLWKLWQLLSSYNFFAEDFESTARSFLGGRRQNRTRNSCPPGGLWRNPIRTKITHS